MGKREKKKAQDRLDSDSEEEVTLLDEDGNPTYEFYQCLGELFKRFDVDRDERLSNTELCTFARAANGDGREYSEEELMQIKDSFNWDNGLTLQGWLEMYVCQARNDDDGTWKDLAAVGYTGQLELPQVCEGATFIMTKNCELQRRLEELVRLGETQDAEGFMSTFAASTVRSDELAKYAQSLELGNCAQLKNLVSELKCCASGKDVTEIAGDQVNGPITFTFWSPVEGADGSLCFVCEDGQWRIEDVETVVVAGATTQTQQTASTSKGGKKPFGGRRR